MTGRQLSGLDVAFLCLDGETTPMHMGAAAVFAPAATTAPERLADLLVERAARVPHLRRRLTASLLPPGGAYWSDDPRFDPGRHVQVRELGEDCSEDALARHAASWMEEPLDLRRPPWQVRLVTGLPDGRFALLLKLHHAFTDGTGAFAVAAGLLDELPVTAALLAAAEQPEPVTRSPLAALRDTINEAGENLGIASAVLRAARPYPVSPLAAPSSASRRLGFVRLDLADFATIRAAHGGTVNDVLLAVLSGALRRWLVDRGRRVAGRPIRALIPVSTRARSGGAGGNQLSGYLCELPVHLEDPVRRLRELRKSMSRHKAAGPLSGAGALPVLAGRIPSPVHRVATRFAGQAAGLLFDIVVTNVPLPKLDLALDGAPLREVYPLVPLAARHAVGIAAAVHADSVHIGLQVNGAAVADTGSLRDAVLKSAAELYEHSV
ncbi:WS/DGAT/MGAT family acyltransferase [Amycolatopsis bartoniae]|uniref:Diacylglycerol O-acyltransferase n=1 Tax=Amycolatopsis bartoniae TaxID=941986 RepID=A0A8H9J0E7_9PSEU|nr:wax ester/triacylglycerol synthase family O-acyltransferase [Amycolatopsis bartoniae]MBB2933998.1 WS/DGAT/MGAT family acyltransferase [Amycolatopsis bartoniae]TVT00223.1 wax ester/triacylglycerol synthase family O-acyltransferase [Amycolatopsis bartoniae]GHF86017.1 diacylglycerol O-acyltransferase [Amycolatopsis bartoniae]